jgi:hypothetical protein
MTGGVQQRRRRLYLPGCCIGAAFRLPPPLPPTGRPLPAGFQNVPREEKQSLVGQVFSSVALSYDIMNDLMSGGCTQPAPRRPYCISWAAAPCFMACCCLSSISANFS